MFGTSLKRRGFDQQPTKIDSLLGFAHCIDQDLSYWISQSNGKIVAWMAIQNIHLGDIYELSLKLG